MTVFSVWMSGLAALPVLKLGLVIDYPVLQNQRAALVEFAPPPPISCAFIVIFGHLSAKLAINHNVAVSV